MVYSTDAPGHRTHHPDPFSSVEATVISSSTVSATAYVNTDLSHRTVSGPCRCIGRIFDRHNARLDHYLDPVGYYLGSRGEARLVVVDHLYLGRATTAPLWLLS